MGSKVFRKRIEELLDLAGIQINGDRLWDIQVHNDKFYGRVLIQGALGLGESYMDGWWDCEALDEFFDRALRARLEEKFASKGAAFISLKARLFNLQTHARVFRAGQHHYDIGDDLFQNMLDNRMIYSGGYWKDAENLDQAQENKLDLICRKLGLEQGMRVLDVGCGWGCTARFLAERCGVEVVGVTVSERQTALAQEICRGLPIQIHLQDYRNIQGEFDRILSVGMFEHVGVKNYRTYLEKMADLLTENGLFLLQTIGGNRSVTTINPWTHRYIFPNGIIPSARQITEASEGVFVLEDWESFGQDYDRTLMSWYDNFEKSWSSLKNHYDDRFYRMWRYFLLSSAGGFRARRDQLWQIVFSKRGIPGGFAASR